MVRIQVLVNFKSKKEETKLQSRNQQLQKIILSNINKLIMQNLRKNNIKSSHSSFKLPRLDHRLVSPGASKKKIKYRDASLQLIYAKPNQLSEKTILQKDQRYRYEKKKARSRAEPVRLKTEGINHKIGSKESIENSLSIDELDHTLKNFKKNIQQNKQKIHNRMAWKKQGNKSSLSSIQTAQQSTAKKKSIVKSEFYQDVLIFEKLNNILTKNKTICTEIDLGKMQKALKYAEIARKIQKFNTQNSQQKLNSNVRVEVQMNSPDKIDLKNQKNFSQWRRLNISAGQQKINYYPSTYEKQNERLNNLVLKTEAALSKYWQNKRLFHHLKSQQNVKKMSQS